MLTLYCAPNTISAATAIALREAGLDFTERRLDFASGDQTKSGYHRVNPKGRVPALETPDGILTETGAILEWIAETAAPALMPEGALARARMREVMYWLASTMHVNHAHKMRGARWADDPAAWQAMKAKVPETMTESAAFMEERLAGPFLFGDAVTLADIWLYVLAKWLEPDGVDMGGFPKLRAFRSAMETRPSVADTRASGLVA